MAKKERVLCVQIPEAVITSEFGWLFEKSGEAAVRTYVVNHSGRIIAKGLTLVGIEFYYWNYEEGHGKSADLVFRKDDIYYVVELKSFRYYAWKQLSQVVKCFESEMKKQREPYEELIPVLIVVEKELKEMAKTWSRIDELSWFYEAETGQFGGHRKQERNP